MKGNGERLRVAAKLAELEAKLDTHVCYLKKRDEEKSEVIDKIFEKLDNIEVQTATHKVKIGFIGSIGGFISSIIVGVITYFIVQGSK